MGTVAIIGPGAMGCLFGAFLARAGHRVWMIDHHAERVDRLRSTGLAVEQDTDNFQVSVNVTTDPSTFPIQT